MRITHLKSATVLIEHGGVRVLCDPWLTDGEYYGAWHHVPPFDFRPEDFAGVDYLYVSHIHPDHVSRRTLEQLDRRIPVLIHAYESKFLKRCIERLGFAVRELAHDERVELGGGMHINILAADDCDPRVCGRFFGCAKLASRLGSSQIDTLSVIDDGRRTIVNVNDCPFELARPVLDRVRRRYDRVDLLLTGYGGAGPYPQCFTSLPLDVRRAAAECKKISFLRQAEAFIDALRPRWYMPFAGTYTLGGRLAALNELRGVPDLDEAAGWLEASPVVRAAGSRCLLLNTWGSFDLADESTDVRAPAPESPAGTRSVSERFDKAAYIRDVLAQRKLDYEADPPPGADELIELLRPAHERLERKRVEIGSSSPTALVLPLGEGRLALVKLDGGGFEVVDTDRFRAETPYVSLRTDPRLLRRLLSGPRQAHWNNAEIGSHIEFDRRPDVFERGLHHVVSYFHA